MPEGEVSPTPLKSLSPDLRSRLVESTNLRLLNIIRANINTQYASQSTSLAGFRDVISVNGTDSDTVLLKDFQSHVPLTDYESYKPFVAKFNGSPCKESEVLNLLAPGLPFFLAISSATSGKESKIVARYHPRYPPSSFQYQGPMSIIYHYGYREIKEIEGHGDSGQIIKRIPLCLGSAGYFRGLQGWNIEDDDKRMSLTMPGCVTPWAASMINNHKSFLMMHGLFTLACRDLDCIALAFSTLLLDLFRFMDEQWDLFVSSIRDGQVPALEGVDKFLPFLQVHLHANPERALELREIGPPFSCAGWAARVWPKLRMVGAVCSGPFATVVPKIKTILGPTINISGQGYAASESVIAFPYAESPDVLVLYSQDLVEFLDVNSAESHAELRQAWELEVGGQYEVVLTTIDGLWRYRLGDLINVVGFATEDGSPIFKYSGRRSSIIRFVIGSISDDQVLAAVQSIGSDVVQVTEFTAVLDDRSSPPAVGLLVETTSDIDPGPYSHLVRQRFFDGLVAANNEHLKALEDGVVRFPTLRVLKSGTFMEYREWVASKMNAGSTQVKVPAVMLNDASREWILQRVDREL